MGEVSDVRVWASWVLRRKGETMTRKEWWVAYGTVSREITARRVNPGRELISLSVLVWVTLAVGPWWVGVILLGSGWVFNFLFVLAAVETDPSLITRAHEARRLKVMAKEDRKAQADGEKYGGQGSVRPTGCPTGHVGATGSIGRSGGP